MNNLSFTQLMTYARCPAHYLFRYICGLKIPPNSGLIQGRTVHKVLEVGYKHKQVNRADPKLNEMLEVYDYELNRSLDEEEVIFDKGENSKSLLDNGVRLVKEYRKERMPKVMPKVTEEWFKIEFANKNYGFTGKIDLIDDKEFVIDHKVTKRTPNNMEIHNDQQLTAYALAYRQMYNKNEKALEFDFLVSGQNPKIIPMKTKRTKADIDRFLVNLATIKDAIDKGIYYCFHSANDWVCRSEWCGYEKQGYHKELYKLGINKFIDKYGRVNEQTNDNEEVSF